MIPAFPLAFTIPLVLTALAALPVLYWLLKMTPPPPARAVLPTLAIVRDMERKEETPAHTPWWLLLLRLLLAALVILAMAGPLWNPDPESRTGRGPLLVMIDNSWSAAPQWKLMSERAQSLMETAGAAGRPVALRTTAEEPSEIIPTTSVRAIDQLRSLRPHPHSIDRKRHEAAVTSFLERNAEGSVAWVSDGISVLDDADILPRLASGRADRIAVFVADSPNAVALAAPRNLPDAMTIQVLRAATADGSNPVSNGVLRALDSRGRPLAESRFQFESAAKTTTARFEVPLEMRNEIARIDMPQVASAGAVSLLDGRNKRRRVGIVTGESPDNAQPLLAPSYFILRALGPLADVREVPRGTANPVARLLDDGAAVLVMTDIGNLTGPTLDRVRAFVDNGGVLIRFASRRVAAPTDTLLPVRLRRSERVMGGALSWDTPKKLASFAENGPFSGMRVPADVTVTQQVLAEPDAGLAEKTWAALEDGTPLITGERRGKGVVALVHVTADTAWSSMPLSGSFVETLFRLSNLANVGGEQTDAAKDGQKREDTLLAPVTILDGFGVFQKPTPEAESLPRNFVGAATQRHPPGLYGNVDAPVSVNATTAETVLAPLQLQGVATRPLQTRPPFDLRPSLLVMIVILFIVDAFVSLLMSGAFSRFGSRAKAAATAALLAVVMIGGFTPEASAQTATPPAAAAPADKIPSFRADDIESALSARLAYVITGDRAVDEVSRQGLQGLSRALSTRTAFDPGEPIGIDPSRDEMAFYPLLYWPMVAGRAPPSEAAIRRIDTYMKNGGTVIFDTRDALNNAGGNTVTPETQLMRRILASIDVPDLEPLPRDHVITKTFYILENFVGRYASGRVWIEVLQRNQDQDRTRPAQAGDRVSPIIITGNDLAAAWAVDRSGQPRFPLVPGDARQREMALRGGINIVMYAMTGNYKADQVHVPALLERLGQ
ncbi:MAG: DUF4159 domain-containing protein [Beijerinckiaceae bacterium]